MQARTGLYVGLLLLLSFTVAAAAQEITGDIRGNVKDPSGAMVSGAKVQVINMDQGTTLRSITTGADGAYVAALLPVGRYQIVVEAAGFRKYTPTNVVLNVNDRRVIDIPLQVGRVAETVNVQETPVQVDLDTASAAGLITGFMFGLGGQ